MSKLSKQNFQKIIAHNRQVLKKPPPDCQSLMQLLKNHILFDAIMAIYDFINDKNIVMCKNRYVFFVCTDDITFKIRKKSFGKASSNKLLKYVLAMGIFQILPQRASEFDDLIEPNKRFLQSQHPNKKFPINTCIVRKYTKNYIYIMEKRCSDLIAHNIKRSNISYLTLVENGLPELACELYPHHNKYIIAKRRAQLSDIISIIKLNIEAHGYCTKAMLKDSFLGAYPDDWLFNRLMTVYGPTLRHSFNFKRPTNTEKQTFGLENNKYIFTYKIK